jgi:type IV pilus assembly protein PilV
MRTQKGFSLIEVLVTIVILAFGLLGVAGLQARTSITEMESFQRSQALLLVNDMAARLEARAGTSGPNYVATVGTGDTQPADCSGEPVGAGKDLCEWSNLLKGAGEVTTKGSSVGTMIGARGCITQIQAANPAAGVCTPGIYEVSVAWQGLINTAVPANGCGAGQYGNEKVRRIVTMRVGAPTLGCS